jgi:hypothetical protein
MIAPELFALVSAGFGGVASVLLSLMLLEQRGLRRRVELLDRRAAGMAVYLSLLCVKAEIDYKEINGG